MKALSYWIVFTLVVCSCSPKIRSAITSKQTPLADTTFVLVLQQQDEFTNDGIAIGSIKSGDNGLSTNCTYSLVIDKLKQLARRNGANVIKITQHKTPDRWSSCDRIFAKIYRVPDFRVHEKGIEWSADRKLTWDDFKGQPKPYSNPNVGAETYCGFRGQTNDVILFAKLKIAVQNTFQCNLSWVRPDQKYRSDLLEHEQGHFDLCEVYTRKLKKTLQEKNLNFRNVNPVARIIYEQVFARYLERQELYEKETNYGLDRVKQLEWMGMIKNELGELGSFVK